MWGGAFEMSFAVLAQAIESVEEIPWFVIYAVVLMTIAMLLILGFVLLLAYKLDRVLLKLESISQNAGHFVQMGRSFFKGSSRR